MVKDYKAVRPNTFIQNVPALEKKEEKGITEEERQYYAMSITGGWKRYIEFLNNLINDLDDLSSKGMEQGLSYEEIGKNAIVASMVKDILRKTINKVEDAKEAVLNEK